MTQSGLIQMLLNSRLRNSCKRFSGIRAVGHSARISIAHVLLPFVIVTDAFSLDWNNCSTGSSRLYTIRRLKFKNGGNGIVWPYQMSSLVSKLVLGLFLQVFADCLTLFLC